MVHQQHTPRGVRAGEQPLINEYAVRNSLHTFLVLGLESPWRYANGMGGDWELLSNYSMELSNKGGTRQLISIILVGPYKHFRLEHGKVRRLYHGLAGMNR